MQQLAIINKLNLLDMIFATSFKHTASMLYSVKFTNSNVLDIIEKLNTLRYNIENNISTGKHVGAPIDITDVDLVLDTLTSIIEHYKVVMGINVISKNTKLYNVVKDIRAYEATNVKALAKEVLNEVLSPSEQKRNLSKKEKIAEAAALKSHERKIEMLKKQRKPK